MSGLHLEVKKSELHSNLVIKMIFATKATYETNIW